MFKHIQPPTLKERLDRDRSMNTALIFFYFWFAGIVSLLLGGWGVYRLIHHVPNTSTAQTVVWILFGLACSVGAWLIGRFNRKGVIVIGIVVLISIVEWVFELPTTNEIIFTVMTVIALASAWKDLSEGDEA
jgi:predicted MFS family arabinose efflux permease